MNHSKINKFILKQDSNSYYIGEVIKNNGSFTIINAIDIDGNQGGLEILRNTDLTISNEDPGLNYYRSIRINDPYHLRERNKQILSWKWENLAELFQKIYDEDLVINIETKSGNFYSGEVDFIDNNLIYLKEKTENMELEEFPTVLLFDQISSISINEIPNVLFFDWYDHLSEYKNELNLNLIYLNYEDQKKFEKPLIGKIIQDNPDNFLVKEINNIGQLVGVVRINKNFIARINNNSSILPYYNFWIKYQLKNNLYDNENLEKLKIPMSNNTIGQIISVTDKRLGKIIGILVQKKADNIYIKPVDNYYVQDTIKINLKNIVKVDLISRWYLKRKDFINTKLID